MRTKRIYQKYLMIVMSGTAFLMAGFASDAASSPAAGKLPEFSVGLHRESISVPEVGEVKYAVRVDDSYNSSTPAPLVLVLHYGFQGTRPDAHTGANMMEKFMGSVREVGGIAIAPDSVGGHWGNINNERSAVWLVKSAMNTYNINANQVYVIGYSMGGAGAWHVAGGHQDLFTGAIPVSAPVTGTTEWKIPVYAIHSEKDEIVSYSDAENHAASIEAAGGTIQFKAVSDLSHYETSNYDAYVTEGVRWLRAQ